MATPNLPALSRGSDAIEAKLDNYPALSVDDVVERTLTRILNAATPEEAAANPEAMGLRDLVGEVIVVTGVAGVLPSTQKTGPSRYVVLDCADPGDGSRYSVTSGGEYVMATIFRYAEQGWLPAAFRVVELQSTSNPTQSSLWLVAAKAKAATPVTNGTNADA